MPIANIWTIQGPDQLSPVTFGSLGLSQVQSRRITQAPDLFTFSQAASYDADPAFGDNDKVTIYRAGVRWFEGNCIGINRRGSGGSERIDYTIAGPWWQLQQVIIEQVFTRAIKPADAQDRTAIAEEDVPLARIILGTDQLGNRLNSGETIAEFVGYALEELGAAALFQLGTVGVNTEFPFEELSTLTVAEGITRVLRWNPDVVASFDYTVEPARLNFVRRAALPATAYAIGDVVISDNAINPRHDLQKNGVIIKYERINTFDGAEHAEIITDTAGDTSDPFKTLKLYFDLQGEKVSLVKQPVKTSSIQESSGTWWRKRHPKLANLSAAPTVANVTKVALDDTSEGGNNDGTSYDKELISGSIAEWMGGVGTCAQIVTADVTYTPTGGSARTETLRLQLTGTNANDQTYTDVASFTAGEAAPIGLAASILDSLSTLNYEGTVTLVEQDCPASSLIDRRLNITGGREEWASMAASIYSVDYDIDGGRTAIRIGPAKHLGADSLFQLYRNTRTRKPSGGAARRGNASPKTNLPVRSPNTTTADDGGDAGSGIMLIYRSGNIQQTVAIADIMGDYNSEIHDNWYIEFKIANGRLKDVTTDPPIGTSTSDRYNGDATSDPPTDQTVYRIAVIQTVGSKKITHDLSGIYRENVVCTAEGPQAELLKIG